MKLTTLVVSLLVVFSSPTLSQTATRAEFEEFCQDHVGRWVGEVALTADSPGLGKKGDKVTMYWDGQLAADGNTILARYYRGNVAGVGMRYYDPGAGQIKQAGVNSDGTVSHGIFFKQDGVWKYSGTSGGTDGTRSEANLWVEISDDGDTHTWKGIVAVDGKVTEEMDNTFRRVRKP